MGGGIGIYDDSHPVLNEVIIQNNETNTEGGGGIWCREASLTMSNCIISKNNSSRRGGGLYFYQSSGNSIINSTISDNQAEEGDGFYIFGTEGETTILNIINSIVWGNSNEEIVIYSDWYELNPLLTISYSDILGGLDGIEINDIEAVEWNDGSIDEDPLFVDSESGDYHLSAISPCIDAGDPDSPQDPDGSRADMGALPIYQGGYVEGFVLNLANDDPIEGVIVRNNVRQEVETDADGFFRFRSRTPDNFDLTASIAGYNNSVLRDQHVDSDSTLRVIFYLTHPEIQLSERSIGATLDQGDSTEFELSITNQGNGPLEWQAKKRLLGEFDPWELRQSHYVREVVLDNYLMGVIFVDEYFYASGANIFANVDNENMIYVLDRDGQEIDRFPQFGESNRGMEDLTWDGELIWGCDDNMVIGFNTDGDSVTSFEGPEEYNLCAIAWEPDREVLWMARRTGRGIFACNIEGNCLDSLPRCGFRIYGLAYRQDDPDGYNLYIFNSTQMVYKMNTETGDTMFVALLEHEEGGRPRGACITNEYDPRSWVFVCITDNGPDDRIDIWQVDGNTSWMVLEPMLGEIEAEASQDLTLSIFTERLTVPDWEAELVFSHNAAGGETILPVTLTIRPDAVDHDDRITIPDEYGIASIYPNPFNSSVTVSYNLPVSSDVSLQLFDILGREVASLFNEWQTVGSHTVVIDNTELSAGLYLIRLKSGSDVVVRKVVLVK
ncbi:T9SS type A sorting domain-containing protein [bacterium]|nr:T9SS type A sorting domain-containing protein [bacterium]